MHVAHMRWKMDSITVVLIVKNEELVLTECLESVQLADEIVV